MGGIELTLRGFRLLGAVALLCASLVPQVGAQQSDRGTSTAQTSAERAKKASSQSGAPKRTVPVVTTTERATAPDGRGWTLDDALLTRRSPQSVSANAPAPLQERAPLGRVQMNQGTFGIETESKFREGEFSDGRRVPGLETTKREQPSYFGLSLSVPTTDKSLIPIPLFPRAE